MKRAKLFVGAACFVATLQLVAPAFAPQHAAALSGSSFNAGRIIDDAVFFNPGAMSVSEIQNFLNAKVPTCDNWGTQSYAGTTRAAYSQARGQSLPFTCLKDYRENPTTHANNLYGAPIPNGAQSAAEIIWNAAQTYGVSPKVLLVLLQKEQTLATDDWPWEVQFTKATGYGCPDTAACDSQYYGFYNQVSNAARQFRNYAQNPTSYRHIAGRNNNVLFSPNSDCGSSSVFIQNQATAGLYNYTPYQPNQAALNNLYGTGDGCSAYGNRNFWRMFNDWFGTTYAGVLPIPVSLPLVSATTAGVGQPINVTYSVTNPFNYMLILPSLGVSNRMNGGFYDFDIHTSVQFAAGETRTFSASFTPWGVGTYNLRVSYNFTGEWYIGGATTVNTKLPQVGVTQQLGTSPEYPLIGQSETLSFTLKNIGDVPAYLFNLMAANMNGSTATGYKASSISIAPGATYTYSDSRTLANDTQQHAWIAYQLGDGSWNKAGNDLYYNAFSTPADLKITSSLTFDKTYPVINTPVSATFTVHNYGTQPARFNNIGLGVSRHSDNARFDFTSQPTSGSIVIGGNSDFVYKASRGFPTKDTYDVFMANSADGSNWGSFIPAASGVADSASVTTYSTPSNIQPSTPLSATPSSARQGQMVTIGYTATNSGDQPSGPMKIAFFCRRNTYEYCDISGDPASLSLNQSQAVSRTASFTVPGTYTLRPLKYQDGIWKDFGNTVTLNVGAYNPAANDLKAELTLGSDTITKGQSVATTLKLTNTSAYDLQIPRYAIAARLNGQFYDYSFNNWFVIHSGETLAFNSSFTPSQAGTYTFFPVMSFGGIWTGFSQSKLVVQ